MFNIGKIQIKTPFFLAPMAGVTDHPFRLIAKNMVLELYIQNLLALMELFVRILKH